VSPHIFVSLTFSPSAFMFLNCVSDRIKKAEVTACRLEARGKTLSRSLPLHLALFLQVCIYIFHATQREGQRAAQFSCAAGPVPLALHPLKFRLLAHALSAHLCAIWYLTPLTCFIVRRVCTVIAEACESAAILARHSRGGGAAAERAARADDKRPRERMPLSVCLNLNLSLSLFRTHTLSLSLFISVALSISL
jgi:hypothetical protein